MRREENTAGFGSFGKNARLADLDQLMDLQILVEKSGQSYRNRIIFKVWATPPAFRR